MNPSQLLAWILCLALGFFASALAVRNGYKTALLEKQFAAIEQTAQQRQEALEEIRDLLKSIDRHLEAQAAYSLATEPPVPAAEPEPLAAAETPG